MDMLKVLVTGATGMQGGAVARRLLDRGHTVHAQTRHPGSSAARELERLGANIVEANFEDYDSMVHAMRPVDAVYLITTPYEPGGAEAEIRQGLTSVQAARDVNVKHLLYSSVGNADQNTGIPHFDSKFKIEMRIRELSLEFSIVRPVYFMENVFAFWQLPDLQSGKLYWPLPPDVELQQVAVEDLAAFSVMVLENRGQWLGRAIDIAGDALTGPEEVDIVNQHSGRDIELVKVSYDDIRRTSEDFARMWEWFEEVGYSADLQGLRRDYPQVGWHSYEEWAGEQNWSRLEKELPVTV
ncbi:MAG: NmrA/HSCARG family protein [Candidatus Zixiibacteriota bacterium]|nr:MAG: NmrA/HSCARG family protein [candidate division Zixibacteria bacterium]